MKTLSSLLALFLITTACAAPMRVHLSTLGVLYPDLTELPHSIPMYGLMNQYGIYNPEKLWSYRVQTDKKNKYIQRDFSTLPAPDLYNYSWMTPLLGLYGQNLIKPIVYTVKQ